MNSKIYLLFLVAIALNTQLIFAAKVEIVPSGTSNDTNLIQNALDGLQAGDTLLLTGDFVFKNTIYLPSDFTWILDGTMTLAGDADLDEAGWVDDEISATRRTAITEKKGGATNIDMSGGTYYGNSANYTQSMRFLNFVSVTNSKFHDMLITEVTDDNFTLAPGCNDNECRNLTGSFSKGGNAMTDKGHHNTWVDCIASDCGSDGWTPKCRYSTFIRCIAANNIGPGFGMYAREEGYANNKDVGAHIIGNKFIDCVSYGSAHSSGFSFNISANCPAAIIKDNYIQAVCYDNQGSGVSFRNKDDAELGIIKDNEVDIVCYGNKCLNKSGDNSSWAGGLGMENDNSSSHNIIENITGSVVCYNNRVDVSTKGGHNCSIIVYHPESETEPVLVDKSSYNNTVSVIDFKCSDTLEKWCQKKYCGTNITVPILPSNLSANAISSSQINLKWLDNSDNETGFKVERKSKGEYTEIATLGENVIFFSDTTLTVNTAYTYRVRAFNNDGNSIYSNTTSDTTDVNVNSSLLYHVPGHLLEHSIYPNPVYTNAHIEYKIPKEGKVSLKVYDLLGREICTLVNEKKRRGNYQIEFKRGNLLGGTYFYRLQAGNFSGVKKIILK